MTLSVITTKLSSQTFYDLYEMLNYTLHHYMENSPYPEYNTYSWAPGDRFFVSLNIPDSCPVSQIFPELEFPDVSFYKSGEIPTVMKLRAPIWTGKRILFKKKIPNRLHEISYQLESNCVAIEVNRLGICWYRGKVRKMAGSIRTYYFTYNETLRLWELEKYKMSGT